MTNLTNIELLEKYFNYELSNAEDTLFKRKLASDEEFKEEYEIALVLRANELGKRKMVYQQNLNVDSSTKNKTIPLKKYWPLLAAAVLLVFGGISLFNINSQSLSAVSGFYENPKLAGIIDIKKSSSNSKNTLQQKATTAFNNKSFTEANVKFELLEQQNDLNNELHYYYGLSLWYSKQHNKALDQFTKSNFGRDADWYIALCNIKLKQYKKAKPILESLQKSAYGNKKVQQHIKAILKKL